MTPLETRQPQAPHRTRVGDRRSRPLDRRTTARLATAATLVAAALAHGPAVCQPLTPNLVRDGGMESWREIGAEDGLFNRFKSLEASYDEAGHLLLPSAYEQGAATVVVRESADVHSGKHAVRLTADSFYMHEAFPGAYAAQRGDVFVTRFMAKGAGTATLYLTVYGKGGSAYILEQKGKPVPDAWTPIEQRILVGGEAPDRVYPRLATRGGILIDDVFVARLLRDDERGRGTPVPAEYDTRIAFSSPTAAPPVIDGRLDEPAWQAAVPFSGFRVSGEQAMLSDVQPSFRMLHDANAVYFGVEVPLADAERVKAELAANPLPGDRSGDVYSNRHSIELFLQPPGQSRYVQYVVSLDGYRFDGTGVGAENFAWNGTWEQGVTAAGDRWWLEIKVPAADLGLETIPTGEGWRLNVASNGSAGGTTWAAVGNNYHVPFGFGRLVLDGFPAWREAKERAWQEARQRTAAAAETYRLDFADRLARTAAFVGTLPGAAAAGALDWKETTRSFARMNYVDSVYRGMDAEIAYARMLEQR